MVFNLLGMSIGQPGEPPIGHADGKVVALAEFGGNMLRIRIVRDDFRVAGNNLR
jgi:hypothetical protein